MQFIYRPLEMVQQISELTGKPARLVPEEFYRFDPEKVKPRYNFKKGSGDYVDLLEALGFDERFYDAYVATHDDDEEPTKELACDNYCVIIAKDYVYLDDHAYYMDFLTQALTHYDCRCEWKAVAPLARIVKRFCKELKTCKYHHHYNSDIVLATIEDKSAFYFCRYLQMMFFSLWT